MKPKVETFSDGAEEDNILAVRRTYDLLLFEQQNPEQTKAADKYIEPLLQFSGRPSLIVP